MLVALKIENFALIDHLALNFQAGLNVLTGETGAGKSIMLDALDAVLGGRVSQRMIRAGEKRGMIEATFMITERTRKWLVDNDVPLEGDSLVCVRELTAGKNTVRSRSRLNGLTVNKPQVEALRLHLIEITAQGQTLQVGDPQMQLHWVDGIGGSAIAQQRAIVFQHYTSMVEAKNQLERRRRAEQQRQDQLDLFDYQWKELSAVGLEDPNELESLGQEQQRLSHAVELQQQSYQVYQLLYETDQESVACADLLGRAMQTLEDMLQYDSSVEPILELVNDALAQVEEAGRQINTYGEDVETDPQRLQEVQTRISQLKQLTRKYGKTLPELIEYVEEIQASLALLNGEGQSLEVLEQAYEKALSVLQKECKKLTELRKQAAKQLETQLIAELKPLAMDRVQFQVDVSSVEPSATGADKIEFRFSPNPGEPLQPLAETASGGEMSRFLLALKACLSQVDVVNTLVFDEVDVGVSGRVAQAIAEKLHQLGRSQQVLCVTHQPMVAAMADAHFRVRKEIIEPALAGAGKKTRSKSAKSTPAEEPVRTVVRVMPLDEDMRRDELAQLAGGQTHQEALSFADALLKQAKNLRS